MEDRSVLSRAGRDPDLALADADIYFGQPNRPVVVLIHGGFWRPEFDRTHLRPMATALSDLGWPVYLPEYRRVPGDPAATVADVLSAVDAVRGDPILIGHSAGGHLALLAASQRAVRAVIALAPVADLGLGRSLRLDNGAIDDFLGGHDIRGYEPSFDGGVLVHGAEDSIVPVALSETYAAHHRAARLVRIESIAHFEVIDPLSPAWPVVIDELDRLLA